MQPVAGVWKAVIMTDAPDALRSNAGSGKPVRDVDEVMVRPIHPDDAGEVLTVQRAAFVQEALIYRDPDMPALTQTLEELEAELADNLGFVAGRRQRIVGAIRAVADGDLLLIGRIAIAPDQQGEGIGGMLLDAVEERGWSVGCREAELFTGSHSDANVRLYTRRGYRETERVDQGDGTAQIFLRKQLRNDPSPGSSGA
ncbi:putative acetyltransferase [Microbacterium trichothecenolyticum]|mgnify:FL=1|uniref:Putative acetyltransferase n=2 Tax=Microbacteriaceae TaxID=85023 RepID=A0A0M2H9V1_MICTR|nr:putative acetyltransferase [Microbacterium trichothecenolyticum]